MRRTAPPASCITIGGEGGIRTPGTSLTRYGGLANHCLQPLGHLSVNIAVQKVRASYANRPPGFKSKKEENGIFCFYVCKSRFTGISVTLCVPREPRGASPIYLLESNDCCRPPGTDQDKRPALVLLIRASGPAGVGVTGSRLRHMERERETQNR